MTFLSGLILGFSLIIALGPQNVFLIRQGALRQHALLSASICFVCDIILIVGSIAGLHRLLELHPVLEKWITLAGVLFLFYYGSISLKNSFAKKSPAELQNPKLGNRLQIILFALGFSLLNPQAIIDSMVIIGGGSARYTEHLQAFSFGVLTASLVWFFSLTWAAYYFSSILTRQTVWSRLEFVSGLLMFTIGISLLFPFN